MTNQLIVMAIFLLATVAFCSTYVLIAVRRGIRPEGRALQWYYAGGVVLALGYIIAAVLVQ